jgi:uncharacterized membrane protein
MLNPFDLGPSTRGHDRQDNSFGQARTACGAHPFSNRAVHHGSGFDLVAQCTKRRGLADTAYYNLLVAAISTIPVLATGILAWQFQLEGQKLRGILLLHLVLACISSVMIWVVWWLHFRARRQSKVLPTYRLALELLGVGIVALTEHLGGFLSGVNGPR